MLHMATNAFPTVLNCLPFTALVSLELNLAVRTHLATDKTTSFCKRADHISIKTSYKTYDIDTGGGNHQLTSL